MFAAQRDGLKRLRQMQSALEESPVGRPLVRRTIYWILNDIMSLIGHKGAAPEVVRQRFVLTTRVNARSGSGRQRS